MSKEEKTTLEGVIGFYDDPHDLVEAMKKLRAQNYKNFDAFTPFPVHGLDEAQGLKRSFLPYITFGAGLTGCLSGFILQYWTSVVDWPINVGGKPLNSWPAFVPVMFECTILFAGIATVFGMFFINRLPNVTKASFDPSLTRDRFALFVGAPQSDEDLEEDEAHGFRSFKLDEVQSFLSSIGARDVRAVQKQGWF